MQWVRFGPKKVADFCQILTLAWAPLIPPSPEVRKTFPLKEFRPKYLRPAFSKVSWRKEEKVAAGWTKNLQSEKVSPPFHAQCLVVQCSSSYPRSFARTWKRGGKTIKSPIAAAVQADATRDAQWDQMYFIARPNLLFFPGLLLA